MRVHAIAVALVIGGAGCGKRVPGPAHVAPGMPHVTWVIMSGDRENPDQEFVCQSEPRNDCVISVSSPESPVFGHVHLYYHGVGSETRYEGKADYGFFQGESASHTSTVGVATQGNESITNSSVTGIVTSKPGNYAVTLSLTASLVDSGRTEAIRTVIPVVVK